jgi:hypothetical protein
MIRIVTALCVGLVLASCQYNPYASEFATTRPDDAALVGVYRPDRETTDRLGTALNVRLDPACELALRPDHSFTARRLPNCWFTPGNECVPELINLSGTWTIERKQDKWWALRLEVTTINDQGREPYGLEVPVRGNTPPHVVHFTIGDPDAGNALAFERIAQNAA